MIKLHCFQKEWINSFREKSDYRKINPPLLEKMIHALSLLQYLQKHELSFIFKGGTSLLLLLKNPNRFSVDIDILTEESKEAIEGILDRIIADSHFTAWKLDEQRSYKTGVPKAHYELAFESNLNKNSNYILLDILFEKANYSKVQKLPIQSSWIETESIIEIQLPTLEAITGDKLTAFAPNTTGISYGKGKELEIIKQLFDLSKLFDQIESIEDVRVNFE
jgi:predicted nucleotidyltransferase component of viral defense system